MRRRRVHILLLLTAIAIAAGMRLASASAGPPSDQGRSQPRAALVSSGPALPDARGQASGLAQAQPSTTRSPFTTEVLPPVVSEPVPTGRGLFDEITDRLLRALLNFF